MKINLGNSKTLWGFGIAILILSAKAILESLYGIKIPDPVFDLVTELFSYAAALVGVYGLRDAIRNTQIQIYNKELEESKDQ